MRHTVVAVFDEVERVQKASDALRARGFDASALHLTQGAGPGDTEVPPAAAIEGGPVAGLLHRLSVLFGVEEPHVAQYVEAVRRGGHVLQVDAADEVQATAARDELVTMGAVDIDDRVEAWEQGGWASPAEAASDAAGGAVHRHEVSIGGVRVYGHTARRTYEEFADDFRSNFDERHASEGGVRYDDFEPAYRFGHELAMDESLSGRGWSDIEGGARETWQRRYPGRAWDRFAYAVRHAWERVTGR